MHQESQNKNGFGILEIVIAVGIIGATLFAMVSVFILSKNTIELSLQKMQASFIAEEGLEVLRYMRDSSWKTNIKTLNAGTTYYLSFATSTSKWATSSSPILTDGKFTRSFQISDVSRDVSANIEGTYNAANDDIGTKKVNMTVSWSYKNNNEVISIDTYLTDLFGN